MSKHIDGPTLQRLLQGGMINLENKKELVNSLNVFPVPDGDTGTNMSLTIKSAVEETMSVESQSISVIADSASLGSLMGARGNSGVILSQLFRGFALGVKGQSQLNARVLAEGLRQAANTAYKAVMKPVEGTILTVAKDLAKEAMELADSEMDLTDLLAKVIQAGHASLARTPELLPVLKEAGVVDAGGQGLLVFLEGILLAAKGELESNVPVQAVSHQAETAKLTETNITYGYCTEFMVEAKAEHVDALREKLAAMGDSLIVVGDQNVIKVHVHTDTPGKALDAAMAYGPLRNMKIDNMRYQHQEILRKEAEELAKQEEQIEEKAYGIIAVASGQGLAEVLKEAGVDEVILGGQTMNPSTEDFLNSMKKLHAETIFILPNNKNIILAAEQAKKLSDRHVIVLPSKTIPQGLSAVLAFDEEADVEANMVMMGEAITHSRTGQVTYAVRDTMVGNLEIKEGQFIGMTESEITNCGDELTSVTEDLIDHIYFDDAQVMTIIYGDEMSQDDADSLAEAVEERYPDIDIVIIDGGQPVYYYLISID